MCEHFTHDINGHFQYLKTLIFATFHMGSIKIKILIIYTNENTVLAEMFFGLLLSVNQETTTDRNPLYLEAHLYLCKSL